MQETLKISTQRKKYYHFISVNSTKMIISSGYYGDEEHISHRIKSVDEYLRQLAKLALRHAKEKVNSKTIYSNSMSSDGSQVHRTYIKTAKKTNRKQHLNVVKHTVYKISKESGEKHEYGSSEE